MSASNASISSAGTDRVGSGPTSRRQAAQQFGELPAKASSKMGDGLIDAPAAAMAWKKEPVTWPRLLPAGGGQCRAMRVRDHGEGRVLALRRAKGRSDELMARQGLRRHGPSGPSASSTARR